MNHAQQRRRARLFSALFCLAGILASAAELIGSYQKTFEEADTRVRNASYAIAAWVNAGFAASDYVLRDIADRLEAEDFASPAPSRTPPPTAQTQALLTRKLATLPNASAIGLMDADCAPHPTFPAPPGYQTSLREVCLSLRGSPERDTLVTRAHVASNGHITVGHARTVRDPHGRFQGMVLLAIDLGFFAPWLADIDTGKGGAISIFDTRLNLLARKPALPQALGLPMVDATIEAFVTSRREVDSYRGDSPLDGHARLIGLRRVGDLPFIVIVSETESELLAGWYRRLAAFSLVGLIGLLLVSMALRHYLDSLSRSERLFELATVDELTGLHTRRYLVEQTQAELRRMRRQHTPLSVMLLDIDNFKDINDRHGHGVGDRALRMVAEAGRATLRETDRLGRFGGDEFAIVLPDTREADAMVLAERLRAAIAQAYFAYGGGAEIKVTASIGVAEVSPDDAFEDAFAKADLALYRAKAQGRDRAQAFHTLDRH